MLGIVSQVLIYIPEVVSSEYIDRQETPGRFARGVNEEKLQPPPHLSWPGERGDTSCLEESLYSVEGNKTW